MSRKLRSTLLYLIVSLLFLASLFHNIFRSSLSHDNILPLSPLSRSVDYNRRQFHQQQLSIKTSDSDSLSAVAPPSTISTLSVLLPAWQVLVVISPEITPFPPDSGDFFCFFPDNEISPARASGTLPSPQRSTFTCELPVRLRRKTPFPEPVLIKSPAGVLPAMTNSPADMLRWNYLVYEAMFTDKDVVVFAKGVNKRQGKNWDPWEFNCVFGDDVANGVRTAVTSSAQEVFRCQLPDLTSVSSPLIKVSLEFSASKRAIPSIAYASPTGKVSNSKPKSLLCACTMVYNVAKVLREWIVYHSRVGVDKFILYDNASEDEFKRVVTELINEGYNIRTKFWQWPKTQEAGFSHCAIDNRDTCTWMMYVDVDEFVYSRSWSSNSTGPMLKSLLPNITETNLLHMSNSEVKSGEGSMYADDWLLANPSYFNKLVPPQVGEIMIGCHEFGPSNQKSHPNEGVLQGYNCRKKMENRHKSIVLLDAISDSLVNVVHHFHLKEGYKMMKIDIRNVVVNHYKFQAWPEFKAKFKRRVSAYVADWTESVNPNSQDRTPGLGFAAVEPQGWPEKFCEVRDNGLKMLSKKWFGNTSQLGTSYTTSL